MELVIIDPKETVEFGYGLRIESRGAMPDPNIGHLRSDAQLGLKSV